MRKLNGHKCLEKSTLLPTAFAAHGLGLLIIIYVLLHTWLWSEHVWKMYAISARTGLKQLVCWHPAAGGTQGVGAGTAINNFWELYDPAYPDITTQHEVHVPYRNHARQVSVCPLTVYKACHR